MFGLQKSYFDIGNPLSIIERWTRPYCHQDCIRLNGKDLIVEWTDSAQRELAKRSKPISIEMQLYFSCVVKKRVLFHHKLESNFLKVNDKISVGFRGVQSDVCSPEVFAEDFPVANELGHATENMTPSRLRFDYRGEEWFGEFAYL